MQNPMFDKEWYEKQAKLQFKHEQSISISTLMPSLSKLLILYLYLQKLLVLYYQKQVKLQFKHEQSIYISISAETCKH